MASACKTWLTTSQPHARSSLELESRMPRKGASPVREGAAGVPRKGAWPPTSCHNASSSKKVYRSCFIPGLHDILAIFEKPN